MSDLARFGVPMEQDLLDKLDALVAERGYGFRPEAIRDLVRREVVRGEWEDPTSEVVGTVTIVYEHQEHGLGQALNTMQHSHHAAVVCSTHIHLDEDNCLEIIVVRGPSREVRHVADELVAARGVKHGELVCTTTGRRIT